MLELVCCYQNPYATMELYDAWNLGANKKVTRFHILSLNKMKYGATGLNYNAPMEGSST